MKAYAFTIVGYSLYNDYDFTYYLLLISCELVLTGRYVWLI